MIVDPRDGSVFAARDAMGVRPFFFAITTDVVVASPTSAVFESFSEVDTSVRSEWLSDFDHARFGDWRSTPFAGVSRLAPGHWIRITGNDVTEHRCHQFDGEAPWEDPRDPAWLEAYRTELIRAVAERTEPAGLVGVETSGGWNPRRFLE